MSAAFTDGAIDKPAKISAFKLPGRTLFLLFSRTFFYSPAGFVAVWAGEDPGDHEKHLSFHCRRNGTPTLFIAVNGLDRGPQQLGHLFLGLFQFFSKCAERLGFHEVGFGRQGKKVYG